AELGGQLPLAAEEPLRSALSARGDNGQKQRARLDILLNLFLVKVAALELVPVKPHGQAMSVQMRLQYLNVGSIFPGVADKDGAFRHLVGHPRRPPGWCGR